MQVKVKVRLLLEPDITRYCWLLSVPLKAIIIKNIRVQEYKNTRVQKYKSTRVHKYKSTRVQEYKSTRVQEYKSTTRVQEYTSTRVQEYNSTQVQEYKSSTKVQKILLRKVQCPSLPPVLSRTLPPPSKHIRETFPNFDWSFHTGQKR